MGGPGDNSATIRNPAQPAGIDAENEIAQVLEKIWLPPRDSNPDKQIQNLLSCR